jgi:hypothetical protein
VTLCVLLGRIPEFGDPGVLGCVDSRNGDWFEVVRKGD